MSRSSYVPIYDLLPADLSREEKERRVTTAVALFRQAIFSLECQGMPGAAVLAAAQYAIDSEGVSRASQEARNGSH